MDSLVLSCILLRNVVLFVGECHIIVLIWSSNADMASQDGKRCRISASCTVKGSDYAGQFYLVAQLFLQIIQLFLVERS